MSNDQVIIPNEKKLSSSKNTTLNIHATVIQENPKIQVLIEVQLTRNKRTNMAVKIQVLVKLEKNIKVVKIHLKTMLVLKMQLLMKMQLIRNRRTNLTVKIQVLVKLKKNVKVVKRASEDDYESEDVSADGSATNEEHQVKADYEDSSASENGKNIKVVKVHLKTTLALKMYVLMELQLLRNKRINLTVQIQVLVKMKKNVKVVKMHLKMMLALKMQVLMEVQLLRNRRINLTVKIQVLMEMEKKSCNKNVSEDDAGSKEDKSDAAEEELKDDDKLYFVSASEDLNTNIATTNKNKSTYDNTRTIDNNSSSKSTEHTLINTLHHHDTSTSNQPTKCKLSYVGN